MDIRPLAPVDAAQYRTMRNRGLEEYPDAFTTSHAEGLATTVEQMARRISGVGDDFVLGAFASDGTLVGYAGFQREKREKLRHKGKVLGMYVIPAYRGQGIGKLLLLDLIARVRALPDMVLLTLTVTHTNASARQLYLSLGFESFGVEPLAIRIGGQYHAKDHMALRLRSGSR